MGAPGSIKQINVFAFALSEDLASNIHTDLAARLSVSPLQGAVGLVGMPPTTGPLSALAKRNETLQRRRVVVETQKRARHCHCDTRARGAQKPDGQINDTPGISRIAWG